MNVSYKEMNCQDVGKAFKLDKATIQSWCRKGYINYVDVSEPGSKRPRYMIPEWEFDRVSNLIRKFGKRNWMLHNEKDKIKAAKEHEDNKQVEAPEVDYMFIGKPELAPIAEEVNISISKEEAELENTKPKFNAEEVTKTILYIQDIKERLEDLEAEKNQLLNELEQCRKEVNEYL